MSTWIHGDCQFPGLSSLSSGQSARSSLVSSPQENARPHRAWLCFPGTHPSMPPSLPSQPFLCRQMEHHLTIITACTTHICPHASRAHPENTLSLQTPPVRLQTAPHSLICLGWKGGVNVLQVDLSLAARCCFPLSWKPSSVALLSTHFLRG